MSTESIGSSCNASNISNKESNRSEDKSVEWKGRIVCEQEAQEDIQKPNFFYYRDPVSGVYHKLIAVQKSWLRKRCHHIGKGIRHASSNVGHAIKKGAVETGHFFKSAAHKTGKFIEKHDGGGGGVSATGPSVPLGPPHSHPVPSQNTAPPRTAANPYKPKPSLAQNPTRIASYNPQNTPPIALPSAIPGGPQPQGHFPNRTPHFVPGKGNHFEVKNPLVGQPSMQIGGAASNMTSIGNQPSRTEPESPMLQADASTAKLSDLSTSKKSVTEEEKDIATNQEKQPSSQKGSEPENPPSKMEELASYTVHFLWKNTGLFVGGLLEMNEMMTGPRRPMGGGNTALEQWEKETVPSVHEKIDKKFNTNLKDDYDTNKDSQLKQLAEKFFVNPLTAIGGVAKVAAPVAKSVAFAKEAAATQELASAASGASKAVKAGAAEVSIIKSEQALAREAMAAKQSNLGGSSVVNAEKAGSIEVRGNKAAQELSAVNKHPSTDIAKLEKSGKAQIGEQSVTSTQQSTEPSIVSEIKEALTSKSNPEARSPTGFKGKRGSPLDTANFQKYRNESAVIEGRIYEGHALDQMQNRGVTPAAVENAIKNGVRSPDPKPGRIRCYDPANDLTVVIKEEKGEVVTIIHGER